MADPSRFTLFQHIFTTGVEPVLMLDDEFLKKHTKVLLRSDEYERVWEVKLDGDKLASGWKEFAADHTLKDGHVLDFRNGGDENFHVSISSRSISSDDTDTEDGYSDDDDDATDADNDDENIENISVNKHKKPEADSSSNHFCFITARVTRYSLERDRWDLSKDYNLVSFGEDNKLPEIDLVNEQGRRWTLILAKNRTSGVFYISRGWKSFCFANELSQGDRCKFKLVKNGKRPVLWLCPHEEEEGSAANEMKMGKDLFSGCAAVGSCSREKSIAKNKASKGKEKKKNPSAFLTFKFTPSRYKNGQLNISSVFTRKNDIETPGEIILKDKYGRKWSSYLQIAERGRVSEWFYLRRGWREMCEANGVKVNDSFVLELIWEDDNPVFKFFSKIENNEKGNQRTRKKRDDETSLQPKTVEKTPRERQGDERRRSTRASNQNITNPRKLQRTEPKSFTVSEQVANVKRSVVDTLKTVRKFRRELETREQNLEASLLEIDALGEKILGISKILNNTLL